MSAIDTLIEAYKERCATDSLTDPRAGFSQRIADDARAERDDLVTALRGLVGHEDEIEAPDHAPYEIVTDCGTVKRIQSILSRYAR